MIVTRLRQISLLLIAMAISALAFIQMFQRTAGEFPMQYAGMLALAVVLFLVLWGLIVRFQPYASQSILPCVLLLTATGVTMIARIDQSEGWAVAQRQLIWLCIAIVLSALLIIFLKDYRVLRRFSYVSMVVGLVLLLAPMLPFAGQEVNGARIWIRIPGLGQFQPGEFAKITVILLDASIMARYGGRLDDPREYVKALGLMLVPFACIMTQPDLGTGLVYLCIGAVALVVGGARPKYLLITLAAFVAAVIAVFVVDQIIYNSTGEYKLLKQYQRNRLLVFLDPDIDPTGESYNLKQAQIAIGSGGLFGKGLFQGTQHTLGILPEAPTDFIFCVLAEELGFLGVMALLALYAGLVLISFRIAGASSDLFGMVIVMCVVGMWLFQILENIGMDCGLMPITGIPLPFVSYAATGMVMNFIMLGMIGSVWTHNIQKQR